MIGKEEAMSQFENKFKTEGKLLNNIQQHKLYFVILGFNTQNIRFKFNFKYAFANLF